MEKQMDEFAAADILLAEDNDAEAELALRALRKGNLVNKVMRVRDGVQALDYVFREGEFVSRPVGNPKLVLLDMKMPRLSGLDVLRRLRADERSKFIPVVVLTSYAENRDIIASYDLGVNG
jgi:two-component system response regulator